MPVLIPFSPNPAPTGGEGREGFAMEQSPSPRRGRGGQGQRG